MEFLFEVIKESVFYNRKVMHNNNIFLLIISTDLFFSLMYFLSNIAIISVQNMFGKGGREG